ncbi:hypothetical protein AJ80_02046 [Polytolypa hystricis UAMH7299]|uniref:Uncharacterized protein n=1 Tax=Polytolypa hystricis (strain UAMH7299) TaxID=1447883 RepID=A0A2B7YIS3_POLH7|nr:hypothetical protein AJ80_02046 [Polytolypa hystricis UAMH7299]
MSSHSNMLRYIFVSFSLSYLLFRAFFPSRKTRIEQPPSTITEMPAVLSATKTDSITFHFHVGEAYEVLALWKGVPHALVLQRPRQSMTGAAENVIGDLYQRLDDAFHNFEPEEMYDASFDACDVMLQALSQTTPDEVDFFQGLRDTATLWSLKWYIIPICKSVVPGRYGGVRCCLPSFTEYARCRYLPDLVPRRSLPGGPPVSLGFMDAENIRVTESNPESTRPTLNVIWIWPHNITGGRYEALEHGQFILPTKADDLAWEWDTCMRVTQMKEWMRINAASIPGYSGAKMLDPLAIVLVGGDFAGVVTEANRGEKQALSDMEIATVAQDRRQRWMQQIQDWTNILVRCTDTGFHVTPSCIAIDEADDVWILRLEKLSPEKWRDDVRNCSALVWDMLVGIDLVQCG